MPNSFLVNNQIITEDKDIANAFNKYFSSIGTDVANSLPKEEDIGLQEKKETIFVFSRLPRRQ